MLWATKFALVVDLKALGLGRRIRLPAEKIREPELAGN
jgi:hypothetical protein